MRTNDLIQLECDRCGYKDFLQTDAPGLSDWHRLKRVDQNNVQVTFDVCGMCWKEWEPMLEDTDKSFRDWWDKGKEGTSK